MDEAPPAKTAGGKGGARRAGAAGVAGASPVRAQHLNPPARPVLRLPSRSRTMGPTVTVDNDEITLRAYILYVLLYVFAQWFGPHHFDTNGDGQFDARDVQHAHNRLGRMLRISLTAPTAKRTRKAQKRRGVASPLPPEGVAQDPARSRNSSEAARSRGTSDSVSIASFEGIEKVMEEIVNGSEITGGLSQEEVVSEHLRQFYPWFCICMTLVLVGLWAGYAFQQDSYTRTAINAKYEESWVVKTFAAGEKNLRECKLECSRMSSCVGFSYDYLPEASCVLLNEVQPSDGSCTGNTDTSCAVYHYEKKQMSLEDTFSTLGGLEIAYPGQTALAGRSYCEDGVEFEAWRLVSYQLSHVGLQHVLFNCLLILLFGIPLEGTVGTKRMACLWTMGVIGGGLFWMVLDAHNTTVGASGGCYALIGLHLADTFLNWRVKRFRYLTLLVCLGVLGVETLLSVAELGSSTSHSAHAGGLVMGLLAGVVFGLDLDASRGATACKLVTLVLGCSLVGFVVAWWFASNTFPATKSLLGEEAYCWLGQVCLPAADGEGGCTYSCARCATRECVESWYMETEDGDINKAVYGTAIGSVSICEGLGYTDLDGAP